MGQAELYRALGSPHSEELPPPDIGGRDWAMATGAARPSEVASLSADRRWRSSRGRDADTE